MELYREIGRLVCQRTEKGAAVAVAEHLARCYPNTSGFSPRNLRRMRDFHRMYGDCPKLMDQAMNVGWTQNVVIMEAKLTLEERGWYLNAAAQFGWSKAELQRQIQAAAHLELSLDETPAICYTESKEIEMEKSANEHTFYLPWEHLSVANGRICDERFGEESQSGGPVSHRIRGDQHRGDRQSSLSTCPPQIGRAWHRLHWKEGQTTPKRRLRRHMAGCVGRMLGDLRNLKK
jgi:hypothetical protein